MRRGLSLMLLGLLGIVGCQSIEKPPLRPVDTVNLQRFMGDWYVLAAIPTFIERSAHNAVESYSLQDDDTIATTYVFNEGNFEGPLKRYEATGYVLDKRSNAVWGMQFIWPIKADYQIIYLDSDYQTTIIGRSRRDYVWIMARSPEILDSDYQTLLDRVAAQGYELSELRRIPQRGDNLQVSRCKDAPNGK